MDDVGLLSRMLCVMEEAEGARPTEAAASESAATAVNAAALSGGGAPALGAWARNLIDRIPTGWSATIFTGLALGATAMFGGLEDAPVPPPTIVSVAAGEEHVNDALRITVQRAIVIDELSGSGSSPDDDSDDRVFALVVDVESRWDRPLYATTTLQSSVLAPHTELDEFDRDAEMSVVRLEDETSGVVLQPHVPETLVLSWVVPGDRYADGEPVEIALRDPELFVYTTFEHEDEWADFAEAATVSLAVEDLGSGAS